MVNKPAVRGTSQSSSSWWRHRGTESVPRCQRER